MYIPTAIYITENKPSLTDLHEMAKKADELKVLVTSLANGDNVVQQASELLTATKEFKNLVEKIVTKENKPSLGKQFGSIFS